MIRVGTAGWSLPSAVRDRFDPGASVLARYASVFDAVEINSSFYRPHQRKTYARWAATTPAGFRFAVKAPRTITHEKRLEDAASVLARFQDEIGGLEEKLGCVLIQLPPSLSFDVSVAGRFFDQWRRGFQGDTALEPRHATWFTPEADAVLAGGRIVRVAADPAVVAAAAQPGGWRGFEYHRLHGSPQIYASPYDDPTLTRLAETIPAGAWLIFDNTQFGAATENALAVLKIRSRRRADLVPERGDAR